MLWDIAGESSSLKIPNQYLVGAHGLIYVFDLSRPETYQNIDNEIFELSKTLKRIPTVVLGNKSGLFTGEFIEKLRDTIRIDFKITSAKSGDNIEASSINLAGKML